MEKREWTDTAVHKAIKVGQAGRLPQTWVPGVSVYRRQKLLGVSLSVAIVDYARELAFERLDCWLEEAGITVG